MSQAGERGVRLLYLVSHPIQYQAPLLAQIDRDLDLEFCVGFTSRSTTRAHDSGFGRTVEYDTPLLEGYRWSFLRGRRLVSAVRSADAIWFHGWNGRAQMLALVVARILRRPVLMRSETWAGAYGPSSSARELARRALHHIINRLTTTHLVIGTRNREYWEGLSPGVRSSFVPYAVDNHRFADAQTEAADLRARLGIGSKSKVVLYCGKLTRRKHPDAVVKAFLSEVSPKYDRALLIVGDGEMSAEVEELGGGRRDVFMLGFVNQRALPAVYAAADVFCLPSEHEPWGLAVNEAMASGTAVIVASDAGCAIDLVDESVGRTINAGGADELRSAIAEVLDDSLSLGQAARRRVESWDFDADIEGLREALATLGFSVHRRSGPTP